MITLASQWQSRKLTAIVDDDDYALMTMWNIKKFFGYVSKMAQLANENIGENFNK